MSSGWVRGVGMGEVKGKIERSLSTTEPLSVEPEGVAETMVDTGSLEGLKASQEGV